MEIILAQNLGVVKDKLATFFFILTTELEVNPLPRSRSFGGRGHLDAERDTPKIVLGVPRGADNGADFLTIELNGDVGVWMTYCS